MVVCEGSLFAITLISLVCFVLSDLREGRVRNRMLVIAETVALVITAVYLSIYAQGYVFPYLVNLLLTVVLAFLLFYFGLWGAGDSKVLILVASCLPGRIFCNEGIWSFPGFMLLAIIFACSFVLTVIESLMRAIGEGRMPHFAFHGLREMKPQIKRALMSILVVGIFHQLTSLLPNIGIILSESLLYSIDFVMILIINSRSLEVPPWYLLLLGGIYIATGLIVGTVLSWQPLLLSLVIIVAISILQSIFSGDNYMEISAKDIEAGMILAPASILMLHRSSITGLPEKASADMRSKLSASEVEAIHAWGRQHGENAKLVVMKKVPFVIYIAIGTLIFWGMGVPRV